MDEGSVERYSGGATVWGPRFLLVSLRCSVGGLIGIFCLIFYLTQQAVDVVEIEGVCIGKSHNFGLGMYQGSIALPF